jgi:RNA polymerase sigma-70 factor, ECF subfamily
MTDQEAIGCVLAGERDAYRTLVDRYAPMVFQILRQRGCPEHEVEDLAQDVFIRAYEGLPRFRGTAAFSSWLFQIAINRTTDRLRQRQRRRVIVPDEPLPDIAATSRPELEHADQVEHIRRALDLLPATYAEPFRLRYEEDLSYDEIAERLGVSSAALRVRVHRARTELRVLLADAH